MKQIFDAAILLINEYRYNLNRNTLDKYGNIRYEYDLALNILADSLEEAGEIIAYIKSGILKKDISYNMEISYKELETMIKKYI